jgi:hypothetical protein
MKPESRLNAKICPGTGNSRAGGKEDHGSDDRLGIIGLKKESFGGLHGL